MVVCIPIAVPALNDCSPIHVFILDRFKPSGETTEPSHVRVPSVLTVQDQPLHQLFGFYKNIRIELV